MRFHTQYFDGDPGSKTHLNHAVCMFSLLVIVLTIAFHVSLTRPDAFDATMPPHYSDPYQYDPLVPFQSTETDIPTGTRRLLRTRATLSSTPLLSYHIRSLPPSSPPLASEYTSTLKRQLAPRNFIEIFLELLTLAAFFKDLSFIERKFKTIFLRSIVFLWIMVPTEWLIVMNQDTGNVGCMRGQFVCTLHVALCLSQITL